MAEPITVDSGHPIVDDNGNFLHAHGGGLIRVGSYYYWFGENRNFNVDDSFYAVSCYRSANLREWEFRNHVLLSSDDADLEYAKIERPKVIYNPVTKRFVMWMHKEWGSHYGEARAAVASCDTVDGRYTYHGSFRPLDTHMSRDCTLFVDDDGAGYFLSAANENRDLNLYQLTPDFLNVASLVKVVSPGLSRESPCLFKRNGRYFIIGSGTTGWSPNQAKYATATSLAGTWSTPANLGNSTTYRSQSAYVLTIPGTAGNEYLYIGDRWARAWGDYTGYSHYVFLPLHFPTDSIITMEDAEHITVDTDTGYLASGFGGWEKIDNRSYRISYSAGWGSYFGNTGFAQSEHFSETTGAEASFTFYGDQFRVHGFRRNDLGRMEIHLDGVPLTTIDCYQSSAAYNVELYQSSLLTRGTHTVSVRVAGTKNTSSSGTEIIVDAFSSRDSQSLAATPSGPWRIISPHSGKDLTETPGIGPLKQFTWGAQPGQTWQLNPQTDGSHHLTRADGSGWVGIAGASTVDGAAIALSSSPQDAFSRWQLLPTPGGAFNLRNTGSSRLADVADASRSEGAAVIQYSANNGENQRWHLRTERNSLFASQQIIEAESAASQPSFAPFAVEAAGAGPGATSVRVLESTGYQTTTPSMGLCNYPFTTSAASTRVRYWALAQASDSDDDDLHFRENNDSWTTVRLQQHPTDFLWQYLGESQLPAGSHTLSLGWRDDGVRIDKIMLQFLDAEPFALASGLKLHFDSANIDSQGNATLLDGQTVSSWKDLSGNGLHLDQPTGTPTFIQPGPGFGGLPVVGFQPTDFNGADHLSRSGAPVAAYPFTVFAVVRSTTARNSVIFSMVDGASSDKMVGIRFVSEGTGGPGRLSLFRRNSTWIETPSIAAFNDDQLHIVTARFISSSQARLYVDGTEVASTTTSVPLPILNRFDLGNNGRSNATTDPYEGQIAEVMVYDQDVTSGNRFLVEGYLSQKWITGTSGIAATQETVDFGSIALGAPLSRTVAVSAVGAPDAHVTVSGLDLTLLGDFTVRAFLNDVEFNPADPTRYPLTLSRAGNDQLQFLIGIQPAIAKPAYQGSIRVLSDAQNSPDLRISFAAQLQERIGVTDYVSHTAAGNLVSFSHANGAQTRITLNTPDMARVQYSPDGLFRATDHPDYFMVQKFDWAPVAHTVQDHGGYIGIHTASMTIRVQKIPFRLQMYDAANTTLIAKDADDEGMYSERNQRGVVRVENGGNHARFGFGSGDHGRSRPLNKSGGYDQFTVTHGRTCVPFFMSTAGYGVFLNTVEKNTAFDATGGFQTDHFLDYWFMAGDFKNVLGRYAELTGRMNLFPKWAYGFMLSKYGNDNATQAEFSQWINRLRNEDYPTDCYVFDFGWRGGKFNPHRWDAARFPDLPGMFAKSRSLGFHVGLHNNHGTPEAGSGDFTNPVVVENWWQAHWTNVLQPGHGDWFWPDEFDVTGDNLMANRSAKVVHERWLQETSAQRPMFITRGGFANHHFATTWSGDIDNTITEMGEQICGTLALGLSGYPWSSNDLGGFFTKPSDALYIRWVAQFGAFSGLMRTHGHDGREPWLYGPQAQENLRRYLNIRYRLFPYIYTTAWQGSAQGVPMMRAMALEHPRDSQAWARENQYYFGDWLLVAPALATSTTNVSVWLPEGKWYDFFNPSVTYTGGQTISVTATLDQIPVFVKEGAIIPTGPAISYADEMPLDPLTLDIYPGSAPTSYSLYEDDGVTRQHQVQNAHSLTTFSTAWQRDNTLRFTQAPVRLGNPALYTPVLPRATVLRAQRWTERPMMVLSGNSIVPEAASEVALSSMNSGWFWSSATNQLLIRYIDNGGPRKIVASATLLDSDGDGLDDLREAGLGTSIDQTDSDHDGHGDFIEVAFGTSPTEANSLVTVTTDIHPGQPGVFRIRWSSVSGSVYQIEQWQENPDQTWMPIAERTAGASVTEYSLPMTEPRAMLRVRAMSAPSP